MSEITHQSKITFMEKVILSFLVMFFIYAGATLFQSGQDGEDAREIVRLYHEVFYERDPVLQTDGQTVYELKQGPVRVSWVNAPSDVRVLEFDGLSNPDICISALESIALSGIKNVKRKLEPEFSIDLQTSDRVNASISMNLMSIELWQTIKGLCETIEQSNRLSISRAMGGVARKDSF